MKLTSLGLALISLAAALPALAADPGCALVRKAVAAGMAQPRIHAVIDAPLDADAIKMGMKPTLMHSIVIDKLQFSNALDVNFSRTPLTQAGERELATDLAAFQPEAGCKLQGAERVAGRPAQVVGFSVDLGRGEARVTLWIDSASGLPLRATSDEPDFDVSTVLERGAKGGMRANVSEKANGKRIVSTHAYLFGDAVRPPGAKGQIDAAALAQLRSLLKGAP